MQSDMIFELDEDYSASSFNDSTSATSYMVPQQIPRRDSNSTLGRVADSSTSLATSVFSLSPRNSIDDTLLQTPQCKHHFLYDSKFAHKKCNCNKEKTQDSQSEPIGIYDDNGSQNMFDQLIADDAKVPTHHKSCQSSPSSPLLGNVLSYDTDFENNKFIQSSFHILKDNYRLWINTSF